MSDKVALYVENPQFDRILGRLERGYQIVTKDQAESWLKITNKVREATPQEVAIAYGV